MANRDPIALAERINALESQVQSHADDCDKLRDDVAELRGKLSAHEKTIMVFAKRIQRLEEENLMRGPMK